MRELKPTTNDDLMKAFKKMDLNGDGFITYDELAKVLTKVYKKVVFKLDNTNAK